MRSTRGESHLCASEVQIKFQVLNAIGFSAISIGVGGIPTTGSRAAVDDFNGSGLRPGLPVRRFSSIGFGGRPAGDRVKTP